MIMKKNHSIFIREKIKKDYILNNVICFRENTSSMKVFFNDKVVTILYMNDHSIEWSSEGYINSVQARRLDAICSDFHLEYLM